MAAGVGPVTGHVFFSGRMEQGMFKHVQRREQSKQWTCDGLWIGRAELTLRMLRGRSAALDSSGRLTCPRSSDVYEGDLTGADVNGQTSHLADSTEIAWQTAVLAERLPLTLRVRPVIGAQAAAATGWATRARSTLAISAVNATAWDCCLRH